MLGDCIPRSRSARNILDEAARMLKSDPQIGLDLTFLIRNATTKYPSVIDGKPYDPNVLALTEDSQITKMVRVCGHEDAGMHLAVS
jgi:hypothetical protein